MNTIINKEKEISSYHDFELDIERAQKLKYQYTYPSSEKLNGIVFIIAGFGGDANGEYSKKLRNYIAKKFSVVVVSVEYYCYYARPENGASLEFDADDINLMKENLYKNNIFYSDNESGYELLAKWDSALKEEKSQGNIPQDLKSIITMTIIPKNGEYQNFGVMQALDHINVLNDLESMSFDFIKNPSVTLMGSSHGGYVANLTAKLAPQKIDCVIDNSSYVKPPLQYIVGKEIDMMKPEYVIFQENIQLNCFVKTPWSVNEEMKNHFSMDRYRIRDILDKEHLEHMASLKKRTKYIAYHSSSDGIAPISDKIELYDTLDTLGFEAELHVIEDDMQVDGKFIKTLDHGMDMSLKELANRELPKALTYKSDEKILPSAITYQCNQSEYLFKNMGNIYGGQYTLFEKSENHNLSIEEQATQTYLDNISYFKEHQKELYEKIVALEVALDKGYHDSKYELEYKEEGYFDVKELTSGKYLYHDNSDEYAKLVAKSVDYRKVDNLFIVSPQFTFSKEALDILKKTGLNSNNAYATAPILSYIHSVIPPESTMKKIDKFIFFGVGLGVQVESVHQKIDADYYLLVEDDLELFRLSLFITNYKKMARSCDLTFSIFEDVTEAKSTMTSFVEDSFMHNHYLKFIHALHHSDAKIRVMHEIIAAQPHIIFPYHAYLNKYFRPLGYIKEGYSFLNLIQNKTLFGDKPVLVVAAGPSLQKNIQWLRKNQDKFIIMALTSTLRTLEKERIKPDIITHLDPFADFSLPHVENLTTKSFFEETVCFFAGQTPPEIMQMFKKENIFIYENGTFYKKGYGSIGAPCVGSMSYVLSLVLGAKDIYLLGLDLALDESTGSTHADTHAFAKVLDTSTVDKMQEVFEFKNSIIKVKGNFSKEVMTTANFYHSISSINQNTIYNKKATQNVYNLSNGAYFEDSIPMKIKELEMKNFKLLDKQGILSKINSSNSLNEVEITSVMKMLQHAKKVRTILKKHKVSKHQSIDAYKYALLGLSLDITQDKSREAEQLNLVNLSYMKYIYPYIFDMLNTKELKKPHVHIKKIDTLLIPKMIEIVEFFEERLELFFEERLVEVN